MGDKDRLESAEDLLTKRRILGSKVARALRSTVNKESEGSSRAYQFLVCAFWLSRELAQGKPAPDAPWGP